jgi:hypothetical protein
MVKNWRRWVQSAFFGAHRKWKIINANKSISEIEKES